MAGDLLSPDDYAPFDLATISRVRDSHGEPTPWVDLRGLKGDEVQDVRVSYRPFRQQAVALLEAHGGQRAPDQVSAQEMARAIIRAAVIVMTDQCP